MKLGKLVYLQKLKITENKKNCILIYDKILEGKFSEFINSFERKYPVVSGEKLKDLSHFPFHMQNILALSDGISTKDLTIVAFGGGTVGDFSGFVASIIKRGVNLIQIPSTWLAAIDSSHGGKTALNVSAFKNQIGTFYPSSKTYLSKDILFSQPLERDAEALGEVVKVALISGGKLWSELGKSKEVGRDFYWKRLRQLVEAKIKVVNKDPYEKKGIRYLLNLGHTIGHVIESAKQIPHGTSVLLGLGFALEFSFKQGILKANDYKKIKSHLNNLLPDPDFVKEKLRSINQVENYLLKDKKISSSAKVKFVFVKKQGQCLVRDIPISEIISEIRK